MNVYAVIVLFFFYVLIIAVGFIAAWKVKVKNDLESSVTAGRDLNKLVASLTMIGESNNFS